MGKCTYRGFVCWDGCDFEVGWVVVRKERVVVRLKVR